MEARHTSNLRTYLEVKRWKVKVTINADTVNAQYLPNGRDYEVQTWYIDGGRWPISLTRAVTFKVKGQGRKVMWCVCQVLADMSRTKHLRNTKIGRNVAHPTGNNAHQFPDQRSKVMVTRLINAEAESVSPTTSNLVSGWNMPINCHGQLWRPVKFGYCMQAGHTMSAAPGGHTTCLNLLLWF